MVGGRDPGPLPGPPPPQPPVVPRPGPGAADRPAAAHCPGQRPAPAGHGGAADQRGAAVQSRLCLPRADRRDGNRPAGPHGGLPLGVPADGLPPGAPLGRGAGPGAAVAGPAPALPPAGQDRDPAGGGGGGVRPHGVLPAGLSHLPVPPEPVRLFGLLRVPLGVLRGPPGPDGDLRLPRLGAAGGGGEGLCLPPPPGKSCRGPCGSAAVFLVGRCRRPQGAGALAFLSAHAVAFSPPAWASDHACSRADQSRLGRSSVQIS